MEFRESPNPRFPESYFFLTFLKKVKSAIGDSAMPSRPGCDTATLVLYQRLTYGTSSAMRRCAWRYNCPRFCYKLP